MINKRYNIKVFSMLTVFFLAALLLSACGGFNFQAQAVPDEEGGVGITGGVDPIAPVDPAAPVVPEAVTTEPAAPEQSMSLIVIILLLAGFGFLALILILIARRPPSDGIHH
jgi:hypothetical protein